MKVNIIKFMAFISILASISLPTYAEVTKADEPSKVNKSIAELNGYDEETWAKLMDNKLEYAEIDDLVKNFNPDIKEAWSKFNNNIANLERTLDEVAVSRRNINSLLEEAKNSGDMQLSTVYAGQIKGLDMINKDLLKAGKNLKKPITKTNASLRLATKQVSLAAKALMINYKSLEGQENSLIELVSLNENILKNAKLQKKLGIITDADVEKANTDLLTAKANLTNIKLEKEKLRVALIKMLGWTENSNPDIADIPNIDLDYIDKINLEADIKKAISNNSELINFRNSRKNISSYSNEIEEVKEIDMEDNIKIDMTSLYKNIKDDKISYDASSLAYEAANLAYKAATNSKSLGMISESAYLNAKVSYTQKKSEYEAAGLKLLNEIEEYKGKLY
jgi:hypothetical protein